MNVFCKSIYLTIGLFLFVGQTRAMESFQSTPQVQGPENLVGKTSKIPSLMSVASTASDSLAAQGNSSSQEPKLKDLENKVFTIESDLQELKNKVDLLEALNSKVDSLAADVGSIKISGTTVDGKTSAQESGSTTSPDATLPAKSARFAATTDQGTVPTVSNSLTSTPEQTDQALAPTTTDSTQKPEDSMGFGSSVFEVKPNPVDVGVSPMNLDLTSTPTVGGEASLPQDGIKSDSLPI